MKGIAPRRLVKNLRRRTKAHEITPAFVPLRVPSGIKNGRRYQRPRAHLKNFTSVWLACNRRRSAISSDTADCGLPTANRRLTYWLLLALLLAGCALPPTPEQARATAQAGGCWPYGADQPAPTTPIAGTPQPTATAFPACTPQPGTPTATVRPTHVPTPPPLPTAPPALLAGGRATLGQQPGTATPWARATRSPALAVRAHDGRAAAAWLVWGAGPDQYAADLWVRVQSPQGGWGMGQTLNPTPIKSFFGGLAISWAPSDTLAVAYGMGNWAGDTRIFLASSADNGASWAPPENTGLRGRVLGLKSDAQGGLYLLALADGPAEGGGQYGYASLAWRAPGEGWQIARRIVGGIQYSGELALLEPPGRAPQLYAIFTNGDSMRGVFPSVVTLAGSADGGQHWDTTRLNTSKQASAGAVIATSVTAALRADGSVLVAGAWSHIPGPGPAAGAVQANLSLDGGRSWGGVETIAQHRADARFTDDPVDPALVGGFEPSLAYDAATDRLAAAWVEDDLSRRDARDVSSSNRSVRTLLAARALGAEGRWQFAITPNEAADIPPQLAGWGQRGALWADAGGRWHWLTIIDERNFQARVSAQPLALAALLAQSGG